MPIDTIILKTIAVDPASSGMGLGGALIDLVQRGARDLGFRARDPRVDPRDERLADDQRSLRADDQALCAVFATARA